MKKFYPLCLLLIISLSGYTQGDSVRYVDSLSHRKFLTMVNFNKIQSYVTFGSGLGNQRPIIFEAQLSPSYFVSSHHRKWAIILNPEVQIRMLNQNSFPIQVPSYHLYLTYYHSIDFWQKTFLHKVLHNDAMWFASLAHHSNGQSGNFYSNDTTKSIDLNKGNFSVNFIQFGISSYAFSAPGANYFSLREIKIYTELYPYKWCDPHLKETYGLTRLFTSFGFRGTWRPEKSGWANRWLQNSSIELKSGWIFGPYRGFGQLDGNKRFIIDLNYKYYPPWFDEIAFFVRFYHGQDYYNIYFEKQLVNLTVGITSSTIRLSNAIRYLGDKRKKRS